MLQIADFSPDHIPAASRLAARNYAAQCSLLPSLPQTAPLPDLSPYAANGLGVSAYDGDALVGFLCALPPFPQAFGSTDAVGVFSPLGANGTVLEKRAAIFGSLYQAAAQKWAQAGASSHAVCLYAHDKTGQEAFFRCGFGMRCADALRSMEPFETPIPRGYVLTELRPDEFSEVLPLVHLLEDHMAASPAFIRRTRETEPAFTQDALRSRSRFFAARNTEGPVAYLRADHGGETFLQHVPGYLHLTGAFCLPAHRGQGLSPALLSFVLKTLQQEGYARLGVDFESINPVAAGFWAKHFEIYSCSLARRIDEHALLIR